LSFLWLGTSSLYNRPVMLLFIFVICLKSITACYSSVAIPSIDVKSWPALSSGDKVAIVAPSRGASAEALNKAKSLLLGIGFEPVVEDCTFGENTFGYANTDIARTECFNRVMSHREIKALFAIVGGQGAGDVVFHLEKYFSKALEEEWQSKPLIGFSDITALHLLLNSKGIPTIHGPVLSLNKEAETRLNGEQAFSEVADYLMNPNDEKRYEPQNGVNFIPLNEEAFFSSQKITGVLTGGNLTGVATAIGTSSEIPANSILVLEDIGETPQQVKRSLWQIQRGLARQNKLPNAMIFGDFKSDNLDFIKALKGFAEEVSYPVIKTESIGHGKKNIFLAFGVQAVLEFGTVITLRIPSWNGEKSIIEDDAKN
jgi:muramoyltetrapeptide carboxypeptidase